MNNNNLSPREELHRHINSFPVVVDRTVNIKTAKEKIQLDKAKREFKHTGLYQWNERNRPGNNKKSLSFKLAA